jgi:hypothetical protein
MRAYKLLAPMIAGLWLLSGTAGHATILLNDNFDGENGGVGQLNYFGFANFTVANAGSGGAVDLIGNGFFDFFPDNGLYVDICGSSSACGVLTTKTIFGAGTYTITLELGGNSRVDVTDATNVAFGTSTTTFVLTEHELTTEIETLTLSAPSALAISDAGSISSVIGNVLLSVEVATGGTAVPEPASLALLGAGLLMLAGLRRRA